MSNMPLDIIKDLYRREHGRVLALVGDLTDDQLAWQPTPATHPIAFNLWHLARWADNLQEKITRMTPELNRRLGEAQQIWKMESLAQRWGHDPASLGWDESGMGMDDSAAAGLRLPGKELLLDYARRAFAAAEHAVGAVDDEQFAVIYRSPNEWEGERPVGRYLVAHLAHASFHLGQMACLCRAQGLRRVWS